METQYFQHKGINFNSLLYSGEHLNYLENEFQVRDEDVFNVTFPKSGTHWMVEILSLIRNNGDPTWCQNVPNWERMPWLEVNRDPSMHVEEQSPRYFCSHLPIQLFPRSFFSSKAKVIYTGRNPKDVLVSLYHFAISSFVLKTPHSFDDFFEDFIQAKVPFGSWFDHIKGWMQMKDHDNFLFITFEELKKDHRGTIKKICKFLGKELSEEAIDLVVEHSSFKTMKENKMSNHSLAPEFIMKKNSNFIRKGICGDWKTCLSTTQQEYMDRIYQEKMKELDMKFIWDEC
ncbi:sulfotransferase 2A1-like [Pelobates fuscus]|uniref:sulfotransferase 2A1-like n=1 Tax=Pelobates fuscus TaxID=191477 RepID=UPI002FE4D7F9